MPELFPQGVKGLADSKFSGVLGSVAKMVGIDIHSTPGLIKIHQKLTKDSGSTVTELCRVRLAVSSGETFWFSYTSGKIWRRSSAGAWLLVHTTTPVAGAAGCLGAEEYDGYIYWATQSRLHRIAIGAIATAQNWTDNAAEDWATFTNTDSAFHPMIKQNLQLFIGDANYVAKVEDVSGTHTFTADALDLKQPLRVKTMIDFDIDILIGTYVADSVNKTEIIRWDTEADSWSTSDPIEENGINAFIRDDNFVYAQAGQFGRIYFYDGELLVPFKRIPGDWSPTKTAEVYPQAVTTLLTIPRFGISNIAGNPVDQGVYSFGSYSKDYQKVLDLSFVISQDVVASIEIGCILAVGADLLVAWKEGANYGVDKLDYSNKYASAYIETLVLTPSEQRDFFKSLLVIFANYSSLPASTAIGFKYKKKHEATFSSALTTMDDTNMMQVKVEETITDVAALQLRIDFTVSTNNAPEVESIGYKENIDRL